MRVRFVRLLQDNINSSLSKQASEKYVAVQSEQPVWRTYTTYIQTMESADCILIIFNAVSSLTGCK